MTTEVSPTDVRVWFGWAPTYRRMLPIDTDSLGSSRHLPADRRLRILGYSMRTRRRAALIARGNQGVRLELTDGSKLLIGSQKPELAGRGN